MGGGKSTPRNTLVSYKAITTLQERKFLLVWGDNIFQDVAINLEDIYYETQVSLSPEKLYEPLVDALHMT